MIDRRRVMLERPASTRVASAAVNPAGKLTSIAGMAAGADGIDDLGVVCSGELPRLFRQVLVRWASWHLTGQEAAGWLGMASWLGMAGWSPSPRGLSASLLAGWRPSWLLRFPGDEPVVGVGDSMGGELVAMLAVRYPVLVRAGAVIGPVRRGRGGEAAQS